MKPVTIIIMSDTHGRSDTAERILRENPSADLYVHLGDGLADLSFAARSHPDKPYIYILGNNDGFSFFRDPQWVPYAVMQEGEHTIAMTHGHLCGARSGLGGLIKLGRENNADIVLYGHTHAPLEKYIPAEDGFPPMYIFNPGSAALPIYGASASYGRLEIRQNGILFSHVAL